MAKSKIAIDETDPADDLLVDELDDVEPDLEDDDVVDELDDVEPDRR